MHIVCSDLEGVFVPEIWVNVAKHTGIDELKLTTREISDYNVLMNGRLEILRKHKLTIDDIRHVISYIKPLPGASEFIYWLQTRLQLIVVSDTYEEFAGPLMDKLGRPTLFCNNLTIDHLGNIKGYNLRQQNGKMRVVDALQNLNYKVIAIGDSYNDINMLKKADIGILFRPPQSIIDEHRELQVVNSYEELRLRIEKCIEGE
jgi:phosphoserine / homoserine phosphotransferase